MSIKKNKNQLIISILVGIAIFAVTYQFIIRQQEEIIKLKNAKPTVVQASDENTTIYAFAAIDLKKGDVLTAEDVEVKDIGMKMKDTYKTAEDCIGLVAQKDITKGHPLTKDGFNQRPAADPSEPRYGYRAVGANVSVNYITPFIKEGAYVDLYTAEDTIKAENVKILKMAESSSKTGQMIIFEIKDEDVSRFIQGTQNDKLVPVLKNRNEKAQYRFSYDPTKIMSFTMTDDEYNSLPPDALSEDTAQPPSYHPVNNVTYRRKLPSSTAGSVEVIEGNTKKVMDFN